MLEAGCKGGTGPIHALRGGGEADEAVAAEPAISSSVMASWGVSSAIVDCVGILYPVRAWMPLKARVECCRAVVLLKGKSRSRKHFREVVEVTTGEGFNFTSSHLTQHPEG